MNLGLVVGQFLGLALWWYSIYMTILSILQDYLQML